MSDLSRLAARAASSQDLAQAARRAGINLSGTVIFRPSPGVVRVTVDGSFPSSTRPSGSTQTDKAPAASVPTPPRRRLSEDGQVRVASDEAPAPSPCSAVPSSHARMYGGQLQARFGVFSEGEGAALLSGEDRAPADDLDEDTVDDGYRPFDFEAAELRADARAAVVSIPLILIATGLAAAVTVWLAEVFGG